MKKIIFALLLFSGNISAQKPLAMNDYLDQVRSSYPGYKGSKETREAAKNKSAQAHLITSFKLEGNFQSTADKKSSQNPALTYERLDSESYSVGIAKTTTFGLDAKLSYDIDQLQYIRPNVAMPDGRTTSTATPTITLNQSLWQNGFGSRTRSQIEALTFQAEAEHEASEANLDAIIQRAKMAYWNLVFNREIVKIQEAALQQSEAIFKYNSRKSAMNLADRADALQSKANFESKKLDLQTAVDNEEAARREFNLYRNRSPMEEPGQLAPVDWAAIPKFKFPENRSDRADVKAAQAQAKADAANYRLAAESFKPVLNVFGSYSLNGRATDYGEAISSTTSDSRPTATIGLTFSMPLGIDSLRKSQSAAYAQAHASEINYQQKVLDQSASWEDLRLRLTDVQKRVELSESIVDAQFEKLSYERDRLKQGRTSTYQVLLFEQDYINARLARVRYASELISILSQISLYNGQGERASI